MTSVDYPRNIVWYLRAKDAGNAASEGSAVAIRLRRNDAEVDAGQMYLLTCAHVVRKSIGNNKFGPCYKGIRAWAPGWSYSGVDPQSGVAVKVVEDVIPTTSQAKFFYHETVTLDGHSDWTLLTFEDSSVAETFDYASLRDWNQDGVDHASECSIIGYPGGSTRFTSPTWNVEPTLGFDQVPVIRQESGLISIEGIQTRPGMSGGGVFETKTQSLVGLHRSRDDLAMNLQAVSLVQVTRVLGEKYTLIPGNLSRSSRWLKFALAISALLLTVAIWLLVSMLPLNPCGEREIPVTAKSTTVACRLIDSLTKDEIHREFRLKTDTQEVLLNSTSGTQVPRALFRDRAQLEVLSRGYKRRPSSATLIAERGQDIEIIALDRDPAWYQLSIAPNGTNAGLPSYAELRRERQLNRLGPGEVEIFVKNDTRHRPDILLLCDEDPDSPTAKSSRTDFGLTVPILAEQIPPYGVAKSSAILDTPNLVAALNLSFHGRPVEYMNSCKAIYQAPFMIIHIISYNPPDARIEFSEDNPLP